MRAQHMAVMLTTNEFAVHKILRYQYGSKFFALVFYSLNNFCFSLDVFVVLVSTLRLKPFQSWSRSHH